MPDRERRAWAGALPALVVLAVLFGGALLGTLTSSLTPGGPGGGASLSAWGDVLGDARFRRALAFTVALALVATTASALLALGVTALLRGRRRPATLAVLPVLVPHLLVAVVTVLWLGPGGLADRVLGTLPVEVVRDPWGLGIVLVYLVKEVPFLVLLLLASWGPEVLDREEAVAVLGADRWQRLRTVVLPAVRGPLVLGSLLVAAFVLGAFEVPLVVGPTEPVTVPVYALQERQTAELAGHARAGAALLIAALVPLALAALAASLVEGHRG